MIVKHCDICKVSALEKPIKEIKIEFGAFSETKDLCESCELMCIYITLQKMKIRFTEEFKVTFRDTIEDQKNMTEKFGKK